MKASVHPLPIEISDGELASFCRRWNIVRLSLFGSALRPDFGEASDLDFLAEFATDAKTTLWDQMRMEQELAELMGRPVDLVDRRAIEESRNWIRQASILDSAKVIHDAG
jgi:hypothetical protein